MDVFWTLPPVTRTITAGAVVLSALAHTGILPFMPLVFFPRALLKLPPEIWRLVTSFLITGPGLSILMDPYFLYTYGSALETGSTRFSQPGDFFTYIVFVCGVIVATAGFLLNGYMFISALTLALAYTYSQENPNNQVMLFVITIQVRYLPYVLLLLTFVMGGPSAALLQGTGLLAAHLYDFLTRIWPTFGGGRNVVHTPAFVRRWFGTDNPTPRVRDYGTAIPARPVGGARPQGASGGWSSGFGGSSWGSRGPGRRLGGD